MVVYAHTSAAVKARADWMVTSACAVVVVQHLHARGERLIWAPDRHLGRYVQSKTGADMLMWDGACIVREEFKGLVLQAPPSSRGRKSFHALHRGNGDVQAVDFLLRVEAR